MAKKKAAKKANAAFMKPMTPSATLAAVIGANPMPRTEVTKKLWAYIKKHKLGTVMKTRARRNPNSGNNIVVYVWSIDHTALKKHKVK